MKLCKKVARLWRKRSDTKPVSKSQRRLRMPYCAMSIIVEDIIIGRIRSYGEPYKERDPRIGPIGGPYQSIGERTDGVFPFVDMEVFPEFVKQACGPMTLFGIYDLLTDPQNTFSVILTQEDRKLWEYGECWLEYPKYVEVSADKGSIEMRSPMRYAWAH